LEHCVRLADFCDHSVVKERLIEMMCDWMDAATVKVARHLGPECDLIHTLNLGFGLASSHARPTHSSRLSRQQQAYAACGYGAPLGALSELFVFIRIVA